jgi:hypothetical protein
VSQMYPVHTFPLHFPISHLLLSLPSSSSLQVVHPKFCVISYLSHACYMCCPSHPPLLFIVVILVKHSSLHKKIQNWTNCM